MIVNDGGRGGGYASAGASVGAALKKVASSAKKRSGSAGSRRVSPSRSSGRSYSSRSYGNTHSTYSSGGGGKSYSGGGGGGGGGGGYTAPKPPSLSKYLGMDSVYQNAVRGGKRSLNDFLSEMTRRRGEAGTQFNQTKSSMEHDRTTQLDSLRDEFASRGLIQSGLYGDEQGKFQQKFSEQMGALSQQQASLLADLLGQEKNYRRENDLAIEQAKQEALLRRSQKYNIG